MHSLSLLLGPTCRHVFESHVCLPVFLQTLNLSLTPLSLSHSPLSLTLSLSNYKQSAKHHAYPSARAIYQTSKSLSLFLSLFFSRTQTNIHKYAAKNCYSRSCFQAYTPPHPTHTHTPLIHPHPSFLFIYYIIQGKKEY